MDNRLQTHENNQPVHPQRDPLAFNPAHSDAFNTFLHTENESAFSNPWGPDAFADPQEPGNTFAPENNSWNSNALRPSNILPPQDFGLQSRNFDQTFSGNPSYNYSGFDSRSDLPLSTPAFDPALAYTQRSLTNDAAFDFASIPAFQRTARPSETISPQALQQYPATFTHVQIPESRPVSSQAIFKPVRKSQNEAELTSL